MTLARVHTWIAGEVLTASDLNAEFNSIINNATSLISPLTTNLNFNGFGLLGLALGSASSPSLSFTGDTNTGFWSPGADQLSLSAGGATAFSVVGRVAGTAYLEFKRDGSVGERFYPVIAFGGPDDGVASITAGTVDLIAGGRRVLQASPYTNATNYVRVSPRGTGAGPLIDVAGADTNIDLNLGAKGSGVIRAATAFVPAALVSNTPPQYGLLRENVPVAWVAGGFDAGAATTYASFNVTSFTRGGTGNYTITWDRDFKQASAYAVLTGIGRDTPGGVHRIGITTKTVGTIAVTIADFSEAATDSIYVDILAFGDMSSV